MLDKRKLALLATISTLILIALAIVITIFASPQKKQTIDETSESKNTNTVVNDDEKKQADTKVADFVVTNKPTGLATPTNSKPTYTVLSYEKQDKNYVIMNLQGTNGEVYITVIDITKTGAESIILPPKDHDLVTENDLNLLPENVRRAVNFETEGDY